VPKRPRLDGLLATGRLKRHDASPAEIGDLLGLAERQLADASAAGLSPDGRFAAAYSAAMTLATAIVRASGYRVANAPEHDRLTIELLPVLLGDQQRRGATYLEACRRKRDVAEYEHADTITLAESQALRTAVRELREAVLAWLGEEHPELVGAS
jgi:hypothetical protein